MLLEVTVSGTIGKQVIPTTKQATLRSVILTTSAANANLKIRDGNASGEVVLYVKMPSAANAASQQYLLNHKFTKGMHVKVLGTANVAYLELE